MSVITNLPAMPNRIAIACEYLHYLGDKGDAWGNVESQLSPFKKADAQEQDEKSGKSMAEDVLREVEKLKLLDRDSNDVIRITPDIRDNTTVDGDWQQLLRPLLFPRLTVPEVAEVHGQGEVPDALSWLLKQDPFDPMPWSGGLYVERIERQLSETDPLRSVISNNARYQNLIYWARYLGLAERVSVKIGTTTLDMVIPDPTEAIAGHLTGLFGDDDELPIQTFMQRLAGACSVLDGGVARRNLETRLAGEFQPKERQLSRSTSLALTRLKTRGLIKLEKPSDAQTWILDLGESTQTVSHVRFIQGIPA
jgi:hypothetical protein